MTNREDERIAVLENDIKHLVQAFTEFRDETRESHAGLLEEINKFNTLVSWGKGGIYVLTLVGASILWIWSQLRDWFK